MQLGLICRRALLNHILKFILGLDVDGLYRVSGNLAVIQKLRFAVNHGESLVTVISLHSRAAQLILEDLNTTVPNQ